MMLTLTWNQIDSAITMALIAVCCGQCAHVGAAQSSRLPRLLVCSTCKAVARFTSGDRIHFSKPRRPYKPRGRSKRVLVPGIERERLRAMRTPAPPAPEPPRQRTLQELFHDAQISDDMLLSMLDDGDEQEGLRDG
jgi:hypothetical protein